MDGDGVAVGGRGGGREVVVYVLWRVSWTNGGGGKVTFVGWFLRSRSLNHIRLQSTYVSNSHILLHYAHIRFCEHTPSPVCVSITKYSFGCSLLSGNLKCLPGRRPMFTVVNYGLQPVNPWVTITLQSCHFDILIILDSQLSPHPHSYLTCNMQYSAMFTQHEAYVHHDKPWCASGTPMENS
ncbi:LOW QUALITY PROTEIN: hypothetical protein Cgig2_013914 [Carnegiea gigantea]|uniref:Uncharacterized protein n=1 Tax=Carnegiea gigantea TaxID=171969 RepID=A0A9Q1JWM1_9CARY|nr:LOW QUALITY PROTEIN: hypothetical protein Cgig2_013914 [Carnegiea gigantea]